VEPFARRVRTLYARDPATPVPTFVERQLQAIEQLTTQIAAADAELAAIATEDATCERLMSVPGVGPVTALRFAAALDEVERFPHAHAVESYLGLVPGEHSSSARHRRTSITKAGPPQLRWALVQAALSARRWRKHDPMVVWSYQVEARRGRHIAVIALARKLAGILFAIWRDGTRYKPQHHKNTQEATANARSGLALAPAM
jgi:transposase